MHQDKLTNYITLLSLFFFTFTIIPNNLLGDFKENKKMCIYQINLKSKLKIN